MEDYNDLLNLSADDFKENENKKEITRYRIDAKSGSNNVYTSIVRFIPWWKNPKESIKSKWTGWLVDPDTDEGRYIDCPSSVGKKSIIQDVYWKLKKSDSVAEQELSKVFSRRQQFASLVQVIEDKQRPELVGKILVYTYGVKIHKKLMAIMQPKAGTPQIPFDLFLAKPFLFEVTLVSGFNNYDECVWLDEKVGINIDGKQYTEKTKENVEKIVKYLEENSPNLDAYGYREWDEDTNEFVMRVIRNTIPKGKLVEQIEKKMGNTPTKTSSQVNSSENNLSKKEKIKKEIIEEENIEETIKEDSKEKEDLNFEDLNFKDLNFEDNSDLDKDLYDEL